MKTIHKYAIPVLEKFSLSLPKGSDVLRIDDVDGLFWMWAAVDTEQPEVIRNFECYKTGMPVTPGRLEYLGFFKMFVMQELCLYVFERKA